MKLKIKTLLLFLSLSLIISVIFVTDVSSTQFVGDVGVVQLAEISPDHLDWDVVYYWQDHCASCHAGFVAGKKCGAFANYNLGGPIDLALTGPVGGCRIHNYTPLPCEFCVYDSIIDANKKVTLILKDGLIANNQSNRLR